MVIEFSKTKSHRIAEFSAKGKPQCFLSNELRGREHYYTSKCKPKSYVVLEECWRAVRNTSFVMELNRCDHTAASKTALQHPSNALLRVFSIDDGSRASVILAILPDEYKSFMKSLLWQNAKFNLIRPNYVSGETEYNASREGILNQAYEFLLPIHMQN
ncbi:hypothetical protein GQX74_004576 [Glossina fuscipes]|nr:hypothetical protein GQX74_004576 [Glossina fuscipes]